MLLIFDKYAGNHNYNNIITENIQLTDLKDYNLITGDEAILKYNTTFANFNKLSYLDPSIYTVFFYYTHIDSVYVAITVIDVNTNNVINADVNFLAKLCEYNNLYSSAKNSDNSLLVDKLCTRINDNPPNVNTNKFDYLCSHQVNTVEWMINREIPVIINFNDQYDIVFGDYIFNYKTKTFKQQNKQQISVSGGCIIGTQICIKMEFLALFSSKKTSGPTLILCDNSNSDCWISILQSKFQNVSKYKPNLSILNDHFVIASYSNIDSLYNIEWVRIVYDDFQIVKKPFIANHIWCVSKLSDHDTILNMLNSLFPNVFNAKIFDLIHSPIFMNYSIDSCPELDINKIDIKYTSHERFVYNILMSNPSYTKYNDYTLKICSNPYLYSGPMISDNYKTVDLLDKSHSTFYKSVVDKIYNKPIKRIYESDDSIDDIEEDLCCVCLSHIPDYDIGITTCGHSFCYQCLKSCINDNPSCPYCRSNIDVKSIFLVSIKYDNNTTNNISSKIQYLYSLNLKLSYVVYTKWDINAKYIEKSLKTKKIKCVYNKFALHSPNIIILSEHSKLDKLRLKKIDKIILFEPLINPGFFKNNILPKIHAFNKNVSIDCLVTKNTIETEIFNPSL